MFRRFTNWLLGRVDFGPLGILQLNPTTGRYEALTFSDLNGMEEEIFDYQTERAVALYGPAVLEMQ
jgi:hypothetical protein